MAQFGIHLGRILPEFEAKYNGKLKPLGFELLPVVFEEEETRKELVADIRKFDEDGNQIGKGVGFCQSVSQHFLDAGSVNEKALRAWLNGFFVKNLNDVGLDLIKLQFYFQQTDPESSDVKLSFEWGEPPHHEHEPAKVLLTRSDGQIVGKKYRNPREMIDDLHNIAWRDNLPAFTRANVGTRRQDVRETPKYATPEKSTADPARKANFAKKRERESSPLSDWMEEDKMKSGKPSKSGMQSLPPASAVWNADDSDDESVAVVGAKTPMKPMKAMRAMKAKKA
jgi:hypothetical protein